MLELAEYYCINFSRSPQIRISFSILPYVYGKYTLDVLPKYFEGWKNMNCKISLPIVSNEIFSFEICWIFKLNKNDDIHYHNINLVLLANLNMKLWNGAELRVLEGWDWKYSYICITCFPLKRLNLIIMWWKI